MDAVVLAAGYATRLYPLTLNTPKALLPIGGKPILDYIVDKIYETGEIEKIAIISNDKFYGQFAGWLRAYVSGAPGGGGARGGLSVVNDGTASEQTRRGAIGDIAFAIDALSLDDDLMVIAGDNFFTFSLRDLIGFYRRAGADTIIIKKVADCEALKSLGVATVGADYTVTGFEEKPREPKSDLAVYAAYIYRRDTLPLFREYLDGGNTKDAPGNFPAWLYKRKRVAAYAFDGECYDIGTPEAYEAICEKYGK